MRAQGVALHDAPDSFVHVHGQHGTRMQHPGVGAACTKASRRRMRRRQTQRAGCPGRGKHGVRDSSAQTRGALLSQQLTRLRRDIERGRPFHGRELTSGERKHRVDRGVSPPLVLCLPRSGQIAESWQGHAIARQWEMAAIAEVALPERATQWYERCAYAIDVAGRVQCAQMVGERTGCGAARGTHGMAM
ncbi:hypothetical protein DA70_13815 [Pandoraea pnomenusa]|nr:hypothetical protein DA70_13815 [Pandoraea pnomenusa]